MSNVNIPYQYHLVYYASPVAMLSVDRPFCSAWANCCLHLCLYQLLFTTKVAYLVLYEVRMISAMNIINFPLKGHHNTTRSW